MGSKPTIQIVIGDEKGDGSRGILPGLRIHMADESLRRVQGLRLVAASSE